MEDSDSDRRKMNEVEGYCYKSKNLNKILTLALAFFAVFFVARATGNVLGAVLASDLESSSKFQNLNHALHLHGRPRRYRERGSSK